MCDVGVADEMGTDLETVTQTLDELRGMIAATPGLAETKRSIIQALTTTMVFCDEVMEEAQKVPVHDDDDLPSDIRSRVRHDSLGFFFDMS
jgi:hypothetical protein